MTLVRLKPSAPSAAITRLSSLADLSVAEIDALHNAECGARNYPARREMLGQGQAITEPSVLLSG